MKRLMLSLAAVVAVALAPQSGDFAPLRVVERSEPIQAGPDGWLSEQRAAEIEDTLADLARSLTAAQPLPPGLIHPDFRGTPLGPSQEKLVRSKGGLEVFGGAPSRDFTITAAGFEAELRALLAGFAVVDWAKFKVTGIEGTRTQVLFQIAGSAADRSRRQIRVEWSCEWRKGAEGKWQLARLESGPISRSAGRGPLFTDVSEAALGSNPSYR
ncbi:MAG: hypothetical protein HY238_12650, partial [Acidobacteria bacterium]|nr:hypothetical protein [Acidobacteriota bacterium]